jgi:hypothetical protein
VSNRSTRAPGAQRKPSSLQWPTASDAADEGDRALANIRAWTDLLVARGNRLRELAAREREAIAAASGPVSRPAPLRKEHTRSDAKPIG